MKIQRRSDNSLRSLDATSRTIQFVASTENADRYGDRVFVKGWQLDNYMQNPVVLWGHDSDALPVGKAVAIDKENGQLLITVQFATASENPQADSIFKLYTGGFLHAVSVGFLPLQQEMRIEDGVPVGMDFHEQELLELSCVNIPANAEALARQRAAKNLGLKNWKEYETEPIAKMTDADWKAVAAALGVKQPTPSKNLSLRDSEALEHWLVELFNPHNATDSVAEFIRQSCAR